MQQFQSQNFSNNLKYLSKDAGSNNRTKTLLQRQHGSQNFFLVHFTSLSRRFSASTNSDDILERSKRTKSPTDLCLINSGRCKPHPFIPFCTIAARRVFAKKAPAADNAERRLIYDVCLSIKSSPSHSALFSDSSSKQFSTPLRNQFDFVNYSNKRRRLCALESIA